MHVAIAFVDGCGIHQHVSSIGIAPQSDYSAVPVIDIESNARDRMCVLSVKGHMPELDAVEMDDFLHMHITASSEGCRGTHCEDLPFPNWRCKGRNKKSTPKEERQNSADYAKILLIMPNLCQISANILLNSARNEKRVLYKNHLQRV